MLDVYLALPRVHQCLYDCDESRLTDQEHCLFLSFSLCYPKVELSPELVDWKIRHKYVHVVRRLVLAPPYELEGQQRMISSTLFASMAHYYKIPRRRVLNLTKHICCTAQKCHGA
jgi:hypothetical protein